MSSTHRVASQQNLAPSSGGHAPHWGAAAQPSRPTEPVAASFRLAARDLWKRYHKGRVEIPVLRGVNLEVRQGEFLSIMGQSGSETVTLLHLLATLDAPDQGEIHFNGQRIDNISAARRDRLRNQDLGM